MVYSETTEGIGAFLRWAGGKARYARSIVACMPSLPHNRTYYEPFLGAGSVFFMYKPRKAVLADKNLQLVNTYTAIHNNWRRVSQHLRALASRDCEDFYYQVRDEYNRGQHGFHQAARFIYLNQTCFNGIFRVNRSGQFNVPYGYKMNPKFPSLEHLSTIANALQYASVRCSDYRDTVRHACDGDIVYLDPPYPPLNGSSNFTHYTEDRFPLENQELVARTARELTERGCSVLVTNADTEVIRDLYSGWSMIAIQRARWITCSKVKHKTSELLIANFSLDQIKRCLTGRS